MNRLVSYYISWFNWKIILVSCQRLQWFDYRGMLGIGIRGDVAASGFLISLPVPARLSAWKGISTISDGSTDQAPAAPAASSGPARLRTILDCFGMAWHWFLGSGCWDLMRSSSLVWWSHQVMIIFGAIGCLLLQDANWKLWLDHPSMFGDRIKCRSFWVDFKGRFMN